MRYVIHMPYILYMIYIIYRYSNIAIAMECVCIAIEIFA